MQHNKCKCSNPFDIWSIKTTKQVYDDPKRRLKLPYSIGESFCKILYLLPHGYEQLSQSLLPET